MVSALFGIIGTVLITLLVPLAKPFIKIRFSLATVSIREVRWATDYDFEGRRGLLTLVDLVLVGLSEVPCEVVVYFYFAGGQPLQDVNGLYRSYDNFVSAGRTIVPAKQEEVAYDFEIFIPYNELHLTSGSWDLDMAIEVSRLSTWKKLTKVGPFRWTYTQS